MGRRLFAFVMFVALSALPARGESAEVRAAPDQRVGLDVTVYGDGLGMISDRRRVALPSGRSQLVFEGISREIIPASALLTSDAGFRVLAIDHAFDVLTPDALLRRALGKEVGVVRVHPMTGEDTVERATVLSVREGLVLRYRDRIETGVPGRLVFDSVPDDLPVTPTIVASVEAMAESDGDAAVDLSYLTEGLAWQADYVADLDRAMDTMTIVGRATVSNTTGAEFDNASLALVAGDIRRVTTSAPDQARTMMQSRASFAQEAMAAPLPEREAVGNYHIYRLPEALTIADHESKQVALLDVGGVRVEREFVSESASAVFHAMPNASFPQAADVVLRFRNGEAAVGVPLPAGTIRVYMRDSNGVRRLLGEDVIQPTPIGGTVEITPGRAFDVTVKRTQTDFVRSGLPDNVFESAHRIEIRNAKDEAVTVKVVERLSPDWTILKESVPHRKEAADRAVWRLDVAAGGTAEITYRVRVQR